MKALNFEIDRIQLHILDDKKTIVDPLTRQKRESFEKNEACSFGRYLKSLNLPENKANQVVISGHEIKIEVLDDKTAYQALLCMRYDGCMPMKQDLPSVVQHVALLIRRSTAWHPPETAI